MNETTREALRQLPAVDELLRLCEGEETAPRWSLLCAARALIAERRATILAGDAPSPKGPPSPIDAAALLERAQELLRPSLCQVINATGVVIHTNLGRAPLAEAAIRRVIEVARGYSTLEYELSAGRRGSRHGHVARALCELTGAEDAVVVNNNAGAVMLGLAALAAGREVIVSRGELVEIGGSFRIPDVMQLSGAKLVEVGATNRTHPADYERAIGDDTALLMKAHRSNFALVGFTREVEPEELCELGRRHRVATMFDLGSGTLIDLERFGLAGDETPVARAVKAGFDLVTFSGDKLLGGPQAGLLVGRGEVIESVRRHPLMRALRPDKLCLAALDATLALYREGRAEHEVPVVRMLTTPAEALRPRADKLCSMLAEALPPPWAFEILRVAGRVGGGSYPLLELESLAVALAHPQRKASALDQSLRTGETPIIARIENGQVLLDLRTVAPEQLERLTQAVITALQT